MSETGNQSGVELLEDYATSPVPEHISTSGIRIAMITSGATFSLPGIVSGVTLANAMPMRDAAVAILIGGLILTLVAFMTSLVGVRSRLSSYMLIKMSFGEIGSKFVNLCIAFALFGWFGLNVHLFGDAGRGLWMDLGGADIPSWAFVFFGGFFMTSIVIVGFKSIEKVALLFVPIQMLIFAALMYQAFTHVDLNEVLSASLATNVSLTEGVSIVIGAFIVSAMIMPDFTRYGKKTSDAMVASVMPYFLFTLIVFVGSGVAAIWLMESDVITLLVASGLGAIGFVFVLCSSVLTNGLNLYGCSLSLSAVFPKWKEWLISVISGALGTVVAFMGILERFTGFLFSLGVIFSPVAAIYVADNLLFNRFGAKEIDQGLTQSISWPAMTAWCIGVVTAMASAKGWLSITSIAACDSFLSALVVYCLIVKIQNGLNQSSSVGQ